AACAFLPSPPNETDRLNPRGNTLLRRGWSSPFPHRPPAGSLIVSPDYKEAKGAIVRFFASPAKRKSAICQGGRRLRFLPEEFRKIRGLVVLNLSNKQLQKSSDFNCAAFLTITTCQDHFQQSSPSQLDNNNFNGSEIPASYGNMSRLLKL
ncbi:hypothetical protein V2J09_006296, partial [Rumex salicifolius]